MAEQGDCTSGVCPGASVNGETAERMRIGNLKALLGFDQRCFPMPETAAIIQKAYAYASSGVVDLTRGVTKEISFFDEQAVKRAFANYGKGEHLWKTIVGIGEV
jgi:hypothetical protein